MNKMIYGLRAMLGLAALLFSSCEREGWNDEKLYVAKTFKPVTEVAGAGGYGRVILKWQLPDSTSSLSYVNVSWKDTDSQINSKAFSKFVDSVCISGLAESVYFFEVSSHSQAGELETSPVMTLTVADWKKEPAAAIEGFSALVAENLLILDWIHPQHVTYAGVRFQLYKGEVLVSEKTVGKIEAPEYTFENLEYSTTYNLIYSSVNLADSISGHGAYTFQTGMIAPAVPEVIAGDRTAYAFSSDISWAPTSDMDSLLIKYKDLKGVTRTCRFGSAAGAGYLSLLPGGTVTIEVMARGTNGTWSLPKQQKFKTKLKEELYTIADAKMGECLAEKLGHSKPYSFEELATIKEVTMKYQIKSIDELELLVNLEILQMTASYPPSLNDSPTVEAFLKLVDRLPNIKELRVNKGWPRSADLNVAFQGHPKVKFTLN